MEALLIGIYSFFVWLIFIKFKWLPWNTVSQVTVVIIPIVGLTALILLLNVYAPSSCSGSCTSCPRSSLISAIILSWPRLRRSACCRWCSGEFFGRLLGSGRLPSP